MTSVLFVVLCARFACDAVTLTNKQKLCVQDTEEIPQEEIIYYSVTGKWREGELFDSLRRVSSPPASLNGVRDAALSV